jgi:hypothetical protein
VHTSIVSSLLLAAILKLGYDFSRWSFWYTGRSTLHKGERIRQHILLVLALLLAACTDLPGTSVPAGSAAPSQAAEIPSLQTAGNLSTLTPFQPATLTPLPPSPTPLPQLSIWLSPSLPDDLANHVITALNLASGLAGGVTLVESPLPTSLRLDVSLPAQADWNPLQEVAWVYALVAPFRTILDGVTMDDMAHFWKGENQGAFGGQPLLMAANTLAAFEAKWGKPAEGSVQVLPAASLVSTAWEAQQTWAIVPFEALEPRWKVLTVDGLSPLHKEFIPESYPLTVRFGLFIPASLGDLLADSPLAQSAAAALPPSNRDPAKLTVLIMTGTTALTRATAYAMEMQGLTFPGRDIATWLHSADLVHTSNEVSFFNGCPYPDPNQASLNFCGRPAYIKLLEDVGINVVELTGNHNNDALERFRVDAWSITADLFQQHGWLMFGGGRTLQASMQAATTEVNGNRIAFIGCNSAGPNYAWATLNQPGAAPCQDWTWIRSEITRLKEAGYLVVATVQYDEDYSNKATYPMIDAFRALADAGATIVDGSQAHTPKDMDIWNGSFIHYGLGNLFFDQMHVTIGGMLIPGTRQEFIDRHIIYNGRYISTELLTAMLEDYARPRPMTAVERAAFLQEIFSVWAGRNY